MKNLIWTEKYRPKTLEEFIATSDLKNSIKELIKDPIAMPNFLFVSKSPGTGKTSLAYIIKNELGISNRDFLIMNSSDERKLEHIRGLVKDFATTMSSKEGLPRLILMDEFDGMLSASQEALRFIMEKYSKNCKFIFTANDETKIIEPIKSRCSVMQMREIPKAEMADRLDQIRLIEGIEVEDGAFEKLINIYYPDMRSMINKMQELSPNITLDRIKTPQSLEAVVYSLLKMRKPFEARMVIIQNGIDSKDLLKYMWQKMIKDKELKESSEFKDRAKQMIWYTAEVTEPNIRFGADADIEMLSWMMKFLDIFKSNRI